jgi:aldehyde dehydrogenase (NAD+)
MNNIQEIVEKQKLYFDQRRTKDLNFRIEKLKILRRAIIDSEKEIMEALKMDLNKAPFESYATEVGFVLEELKYTLKHLPNWVKSKRAKTPIKHFLSTSCIYPEPYGVTLIISPWNYPFQLAIAPLIGSIAAGNCTIIKPSEYSSHTSEVIYKLISENFHEDYISVIMGGAESSKTLLKEKFDYIFFTGSVQVGKIVMEAASKHLTPVTLELGGKSPCIVDETANIDLAAKRIVWGKFLNAGQTCVAPDYLMVHSSVKEKLINRMKEYITVFYGTNPLASIDYPKIINDNHFNRLLDLLKGENIVLGGQYSHKTNQISPTLIDNASWESPIMQEEIFGPLLPVLEYENLNEVISIVNKRPKPLALYYFSNSRERQKKIIQSISFGGGCINDTMVHLGTPYMPFGGVGDSGMGGYHGKASFDTFSHKKAILKKSNLLDIPLRYPPFKNKLGLLKKIMR